MAWNKKFLFRTDFLNNRENFPVLYVCFASDEAYSLLKNVNCEVTNFLSEFCLQVNRIENLPAVIYRNMFTESIC